MKLFKLLREYKTLENAIKDIRCNIDSEKAKLESITQSTSKAKADFEIASNTLAETRTQITSAKEALDKYHGKLNAIETMEEYCIPVYEDSLEDLKHQRYLAQEELEEILGYDKNGEDGIWSIATTYRLNGSVAGGERMQVAFGSGLGYALSAYIDKKEKTATLRTISKVSDDIRNKLKFYQKRAEKVGIEINPEYVEARIEIIELNAKIKDAEKVEKAKLREERRRQKEAEQLAREIEKVRVEINTERLRFDKALGRATTEQEREEIKAQLASIDKREQEVNYREQHNRSGWLYVIDTPAMPEMVKIGATRRMQVTTRVAELSSASVPFPFVIRGFVFADDVFELENNIHKYFDDKRVNKENLHKEFFAITPEEVIDVLRNVFNCEVHFLNKSEQEEEIENDD